MKPGGKNLSDSKWRVGLGQVENNDLMESNMTVEKSLLWESKLTELAEREQDEMERPERLSALPRTGFF